MDGAHALPEELWLLIFGYLAYWDLKTLIRVNKAFRALYSSLIWQKVIICSLIPKHIEKAEAILRDPQLAQRVTHLRLGPSYWDLASVAENELEKTWTRLWSTSSPTIWRALKQWKLSHPVLSWRVYRRSLQSNEVSTRIVPLLTHVTEITAIPYLSRGSSIPSAKPNRKIWAGLKAEHLQRLNFKLSTIESVRMLSKTLKNLHSPLVLGSVQTVFLELDILGRNIVPELHDDFRAILDCARSSVRFLGIRELDTIGHGLNEVLRSPGIFPNLIQFHIETPFYFSDDLIRTTGQYIYPFVLNHRSTLTKLHLPTVQTSGTVLRALLGGYSQHDDPSFRLETFTLGFRFSLNSFGKCIPSFKRFTGTLTCLRLHPHIGDAGFSYDDMRALLNGLRRPTGGIGLKRFSTSVDYLSPEILDLMAESLTNLECLELHYRMIAGKKDQYTGVHLTDQFFENMRSRCYLHWGLRRLYIRLSKPDPRRYHIPVNIHIPVQFLKELIPSLKEVGEIDWTDAEFDSKPLT